MGGNIVQSVKISDRWQEYRDVHFRLYAVTKDVEAYKKSIACYQHVLKGVAGKIGKTILQTLIDILNTERDHPMVSIKFICAGYDLITGNDYTEEFPMMKKGGTE